MLTVLSAAILVFNCFVVYPQKLQSSINNDGDYSWIGKTERLNVTIILDPKVPKVYHQTHILFEISSLNGSDQARNITAIATIIGSDGEIYKFGKQEVQDGKYSINYIFPNDYKNKILLQIYKNGFGLALASFDVKATNTTTIPPTLSDNSNPDRLGNLLANLLNSLFGFFRLVAFEVINNLNNVELSQ